MSNCVSAKEALPAVYEAFAAAIERQDSQALAGFYTADCRVFPTGADIVSGVGSIPGFFEPWAIDGRDYVDGGVGFCGHADLAAETGAGVVVVVNPLVPNQERGVVPLRSRGLYFHLSSQQLGI